jgi:3,4-dihydroxy 2-butanone 4-phosphate synthase / GTP cyclohydrolase II
VLEAAHLGGDIRKSVGDLTVIRSSLSLASVVIGAEEAIAQIADGMPVLVSDPLDREGETDLTIAARHVTDKIMAFMMKQCSGIICVACDGSIIDRLNIAQMVTDLPPGLPFDETAFTVSVDHISTGSGISAKDRAKTAQQIADPSSQANDFSRPGHLFPLRAREGGVLMRKGHTEAGVDLAKLAGLQPAAVICEVLNNDGEAIRGASVLEFGKYFGYSVVTVDALEGYRESLVA